MVSKGISKFLKTGFKIIYETDNTFTGFSCKGISLSIAKIRDSIKMLQVSMMADWISFVNTAPSNWTAWASKAHYAEAPRAVNFYGAGQK